MLSFLNIISPPSSPTTSAPSTPRSPPPPQQVTGIIADASKHEVTIVCYAEQPDFAHDGASASDLLEDCSSHKIISYRDDWVERDWDEKDWDADAEEWNGPNW